MLNEVQHCSVCKVCGLRPQRRRLLDAGKIEEHCLRDRSSSKLQAGKVWRATMRKAEEIAIHILDLHRACGVPGLEWQLMGHEWEAPAVVLVENTLNRDGSCCKTPDLVGGSGGPGRGWLEAGIGKTWLQDPLWSREPERRLKQIIK